MWFWTTCHGGWDGAPRRISNLSVHRWGTYLLISHAWLFPGGDATALEQEDTQSESKAPDESSALGESGVASSTPVGMK